MSFRLYGNMYTFICVHLVHSVKRYEKRNEMMSDLIKNLRIFREEMDSDVFSEMSFLMGDFNYRMETTYDELHP